MTQEYSNEHGVARVTTSNSGDPANLRAMEQAHQAEQGADKFTPTSKSVGETRSVVIGGNQAPDRSFRRFQNDPAPTSTDDILATARTAFGGPVTRTLRDDDTVDVGGMRTTVKAAIAARFLTRGPDGTVQQPGREQIAPRHDQQAPQQHQQPPDQQQQQSTEAKLPDPFT